MAVADFSIAGPAGANFNRRTQEAEYAVGTTARGTGNTAWVYVSAAASVATGTCTVDSAHALTDTAGDYTADTAFAAGDYGWVRKTALDVA